MIDAGVSYREDVEEVFSVMREVAADMRKDEALAPLILDDIEIAGVDAWTDSAVIVRSRFRVLPLQQWIVKRAFPQRLKKGFDQRGIEIPFPHLTVFRGDSLRRLLHELDDFAVPPAFDALAELSFPVGWALAAEVWKIPVADSLTAYLWSWCENQAMAALKAVPLGQTAGQRILLALGSRLCNMCML